MAENVDGFIDEIADAVIVPPDGGWGWVIVCASFMCNVIVDGIIFTVGSGLQPEWERYYGVSTATASWPVSLLSGLYLIAGPIVSALANIFGCRRVVMAGSVIAFTGFILSMFAPTMLVLYLTFGVLGGIGFGFIFMPSVVIVSYYFEKRRALATGIAVCGSGIGTFVFAPLLNYLLTIYTWQSCLLILSGVTLNCVVCGMLFKELEPSKSQMRGLQKKYDDHKESLLALNLSNSSLHRARKDSHEASPMRETGGLGRRHADSKTYIDHLGQMRHYSLFSINDQPTGQEQIAILKGVSKQSVQKLNRPMSRTDIFYTGSVTQLPQFKSAQNMPHYIASTTRIDELIDETPAGQSLTKTLRSLLDFSLIRSPSFIVLSLSGFFTLSGFFVPFIYLPSYAGSLGHSKASSTFLVSLLGGTNIVARVLCGWVSDHPKVDALMLNNVALVLGGLATMVVPHLQAYWLLGCYCVVFGFATACFASLRSIICVELLGLERLTNAFGLMLMFLGIASLIGSPLAGSLYDLTGTYTLSFYVAGGLVALSGLIGFTMRKIAAWENKRRRPQTGVKHRATYLSHSSHRDVAVIPEDAEEDAA